MKFIGKSKFEKYIDKDLIAFLKRKNIYNQYCFNLDEYLSRVNINCRILIPIDLDGFYWDNTSEGELFWSDLDDEFCKLFPDKKQFIKLLKELL